MMKGLSRAGAAVAAALLGVLAVVVASGTAHAAPAPVDFKWPDDQGVFTGEKRVEVHLWYGLAPALDRRATLTLKSLDDPNRPEIVIGPKPVGGGACVPVSFDVPRPLYNGKYEATVTSEVPLGTVGTPNEDCTGASDAAPVSFAVPPAAPKDLTGTLRGRTVLLRWTKSPEGDVVAYRVMRAKGNGPFERLDDVKTASLGVTAEEGGEQRFQVIALRQGATKTDPLLESAPSAVFTTTVPPPPPAAVVPGPVSRRPIAR
ncbi:MAG TPA: hypothetical protein VHE80_04060, partial [Acidimicrobiales bacterium]|nr:hypothetical protein [Acidimicrobiales bacterium]